MTSEREFSLFLESGDEARSVLHRLEPVAVELADHADAVEAQVGNLMLLEIGPDRLGRSYPFPARAPPVESGTLDRLPVRDQSAAEAAASQQANEIPPIAASRRSSACDRSRSRRGSIFLLSWRMILWQRNYLRWRRRERAAFRRANMPPPGYRCGYSPWSLRPAPRGGPPRPAPAIAARTSRSARRA